MSNKYSNASIANVGSDGGVEVLSITASGTDAGTTRVCKEVIFWTPDSDIYFTVGTTVADANDVLLPPTAPITFPIDDPSKLQFFNNGSGTETVYMIWRV